MKGISIIALLLVGACGWEGACPKHLPIVVSTARSSYSIRTMQNAADWWNHRVGWEAIRLEEGGTVEVQQVYFIEYPHCDGASGCAYISIDITGGIDECLIYMVPADTERAMLILAHEYGHCMGLGHDEDRESIMNIYYGANQEVFPEHVDHLESCR